VEIRELLNNELESGGISVSEALVQKTLERISLERTNPERKSPERAGLGPTGLERTHSRRARFKQVNLRQIDTEPDNGARKRFHIPRGIIAAAAILVVLVFSYRLIALMGVSNRKDSNLGMNVEAIPNMAGDADAGDADDYGRVTSANDANSDEEPWPSTNDVTPAPGLINGTGNEKADDVESGDEGTAVEGSTYIGLDGDEASNGGIRNKGLDGEEKGDDGVGKGDDGADKGDGLTINEIPNGTKLDEVVTNEGINAEYIYVKDGTYQALMRTINNNSQMINNDMMMTYEAYNFNMGNAVEEARYQLAYVEGDWNVDICVYATGIDMTYGGSKKGIMIYSIIDKDVFFRELSGILENSK